MSTLFFSVLIRLKIKITSNRDLAFGDTEYLLLKGYVPNICQLKSEPKKVDVFIKHTESKERKLIQKEDYIHIFDTWDGVFPADLYHLLYGIVRVQLLKRKLFSVHGACVGKDGCVLIVGHSGSGKTSVVLKLLQDKGVKVFSGNKTVVSFGSDKLVAVAGTPTITIRSADEKKLKELDVSNMVSCWERYAFTLSPERYENKKSVRVKAIVMTRLNDYEKEYKKINPLSALHNLYPFFLDVVNADVVMSNAEDVFIGTPPKGTEKYLAEHLKRVLENTPVYSLIGSSTFVADEILKL